MTDIPDIEFQSLKEAADYAKVHRQAIFMAIKKNQLKGEKKEIHGKSQWCIFRKDLDEYRSNKYNREKRIVDGEKLFDLELDRWSVLHAAKTLSAVLGKPYPPAHIYYLLRTGQLRAQKKAGAWVITRQELIDLYKTESGQNPDQLSFA